MKDLLVYLIESKKLKKKEIPNKLYHATIRQRLSSIKKFGLGGKIPRNRFWDYKGTDYEKITQGFFCDRLPENAYYYVENSDEIWDRYEDFDESDILLFEIDKKDLDLSKLSIDKNNADNENEINSFFYDGVVPFKKLKKISTDEY